MINTPLRKLDKSESKFAKSLASAALGESFYEPESASSIAIDELSAYAHQYLRHCLVSKMSSRTIKIKEYVLRLLLDYHSDLGKLSVASVENLSLALSNNLDVVTVNTYMQHIKTFLKWSCEACGAPKIYDSIVVPRRPQRHQPALSTEQIRMIIEQARRSRYPLHNEVIVSLCTDTGLRATEMCELNVGDLSLITSPGSAVVRHGKGDKLRTVYFGDRVTGLLRKYIKFRRNNMVAPVLIAHGGTKRGERMTRSGIRLAISKLAKAAGITDIPVGAHTLRRSAGIELLRNGADIKDIQELYGHSDLETTEIYVARAQSRLRDRYKASSPIDNITSGL